MSIVSVALFLLAVAAICKADPALLALKSPLFPGQYLQNVLDAQYLSSKPYEFGYEFADGLGMAQHRREVADGSGAVKGSYGYIDRDGTLREVNYMADTTGYKADIKTNEPGLALQGQSSADARYFVHPPTAAAVAQGLKSFFPKIVV